MHRDAPTYRYKAGHVREIQVRRMMQLARNLPANSTYCEIGMNGGHSLVAMLLAHLTLTAHVFDLLALGYSQSVVQLIETRFRNRVHFHKGHSSQTVRAWHSKLSAMSGSTCHQRSGNANFEDVSYLPDCPTCDMVFVDGDHTFSGSMLDLRHMRNLTKLGAPVVVDDVQVSPGKALRVLSNHGLATIVEMYGPYPPAHRFNPCSRDYANPQDCHTHVAAYLSLHNITNNTKTGRGPEQYHRYCKHLEPMCLPWGFAVASFYQNVTS